MVKVFASGVGHLSALQGQEDDRHAHATLKWQSDSRNLNHKVLLVGLTCGVWCRLCLCIRECAYPVVRAEVRFKTVLTMCGMTGSFIIRAAWESSGGTRLIVGTRSSPICSKWRGWSSSTSAACSYFSTSNASPQASWYWQLPNSATSGCPVNTWSSTVWILPA
jgi:hypothetical protein